MTKMTRIEIDCSTGIESIIELSEAEIAELEAQAAIAEQQKAEADEKAEADAQAKAALLAKLGITADEAKLLLA